MYASLSRIKHFGDYTREGTIYISESHYKLHQRIPLHAHDFYEICVITEGQLLHDCNGTQLVIGKGTMQMIHPLDVHTYEGYGEGVNRLINIAFSEEVYKKICRHLEIEGLNRGTLLYKAFQTDQLTKRLKMVELSRMTSYQLLVALFIDYHCEMQPFTTDGYEKVVPIWLKKSMNAMVEPDNLRGGLARFVQLSGKSKEHLARTMKELLGTTAGRWVNEHRLEYGRNLIREGMNVIDVVFETGYNSESYFYRQYKAYFGVTPKGDIR